MKISAVIAAGCLSLVSATWTASADQQQAPAQTPSTGSGQVGSGSGVNSDPATQGTTDRAGQTPRPSGTSGTAGRPPTGSVLVERPSSGGSGGTRSPEDGGSAQGATSQEGDRTRAASDSKPTKSGKTARHPQKHRSGVNKSQNEKAAQGRTSGGDNSSPR
jgi:hypothetical protein